VLPDVVTLVPERREERTTEGGLDVIANEASLRPKIERFLAAGIRVSLFIAADPTQVEASKRLGVQQIELHTGPYSHAKHANVARELNALAVAAKQGAQMGLSVAAGHGLNRPNVSPLVAIAEIEELNIGHAIIADSIFMGLPQAVEAMRAAILRGRR
jgi:pyridoxine 5-phosphate synthase